MRFVKSSSDGEGRLGKMATRIWFDVSWSKRASFWFSRSASAAGTKPA